MFASIRTMGSSGLSMVELKQLRYRKATGTATAVAEDPDDALEVEVVVIVRAETVGAAAVVVGSIVVLVVCPDEITMLFIGELTPLDMAAVDPARDADVDACAGMEDDGEIETATDDSEDSAELKDDTIELDMTADPLFELDIVAEVLDENLDESPELSSTDDDKADELELPAIDEGSMLPPAETRDEVKPGIADELELPAIDEGSMLPPDKTMDKDEPGIVDGDAEEDTIPALDDCDVVEVAAIGADEEPAVPVTGGATDDTIDETPATEEETLETDMDVLETIEGGATPARRAPHTTLLLPGGLIPFFK